MVEIRDPSTRKGAEVDSEGHLSIHGAVAAVQAHANFLHGDAYTLDLDGVTAGADADYFVYMLNSADVPMFITSVTLWANQNKDDENVEAWIGKALTSVANNTEVTPANLNGGTARSAVGTFYVSDGTAGGITTLAGGAQAGRFKFNTWPTKWEKRSQWVIPKNSTFCLKTEKDNKYTGYISFYYHGE